MIHKTKDNLSIYYELRGNATSSKKIILLNGLTQTTVAWEFVVMQLQNDYQILLCDLVFQGKSSKANHHRTFDEHANDINDLLTAVMPGKVTVAGISYGSLVAQHYAVLFPKNVDKLILISTFAHKTAMYKSIELSWKNALHFGGYELMLDVMLPYVLGQTYFEKPLIPIDVLKTFRKDLHPDAESIFKLMQATEEREDYLEQLKKVTAPTLIIQGRLDLLLPVYYAEAIHEVIKGSRLEILENVGHTINLEAPVLLANLIKNF